MSVRIINADVFEGLAQLPDESVHCVVTSPPYFGLRDYGTASWRGGDPNCFHSAIRRGHGEDEKQATSAGSSRDKIIGSDCRLCGAKRIDCQIGIEPSFADHLSVLVKVFQEVMRVLRKDGTLWLNYGDAYAGTGKSGGGQDGERRGLNGYGASARVGKGTWQPPTDNFKQKDLMMMPARLAIALCDDGWWLRSDIIWHKPNPMPESCRDRPTSSHEHIFLLTKSSRYYYDADAIRETAIASSLTSMDDGPQKLPNGSNANAGRNYTGKNEASQDRRKAGFNERWDAREIGAKGNANGFRGGSYVNGEPGPRVTKGNGPNPTLSRNIRNVWTIATAPFPEAHFATFPPELAERCIKAGCPSGGTVLDPFGGSGTTALVADRLGRDAILIELNPQYAAMARARIENDAPIFASAEIVKHDKPIQETLDFDEAIA